VLAQTNAVPLVNQPLVPTAVAPGGPSFTLTVNGTGFVSTSTINWNGTPLATTFVSSSQLTATVPAANIAKGSTASITVSSPAPGGGTSNVLFFAVSAPTTLQFTSFPSNTGVGALDTTQPLAADFNRDGKLDFGLINEFPDENAQTIYTFLGNGDGTFQPLQFTYAFSEWWAVGDFNGDGIPDVAGTWCTIEPELECYLFIQLGNGDGTFRGQFGYGSTGFYPGPLAIGDFNGDGRLDVATAGGYGIYVFLGNGDGTFQNPVTSDNGVNLVAGVGDFNGDGKLDLIGVEGTQFTQLVWLQGNGDGTFQAPSTYYTLGTDTGRIIAADLNGDGKLDLITVQDAPTNTFTVLLGNGNGTFQLGTPYPIGSSLRGGVIGDFNADGKLDLVLSNPATTPDTLLLPGNGDGTFQSPLVLASGLGMFDSVAGDFNDDGKLDLVLVSDDLGADGLGPVYLLQETPLPELSPVKPDFCRPGGWDHEFAPECHANKYQ
jgi:hypothetical protein